MRDLVQFCPNLSHPGLYYFDSPHLKNLINLVIENSGCSIIWCRQVFDPVWKCWMFVLKLEHLPFMSYSKYPITRRDLMPGIKTVLYPVWYGITSYINSWCNKNPQFRYQLTMQAAKNHPESRLLWNLVSFDHKKTEKRLTSIHLLCSHVSW